MVRFLLLMILVASLFVAGCAKNAVPPQAQVRGKVTLDKEPLKEGSILFSTPGMGAETLPIKDGAYEGSVEVGERLVQILAYKDMPSLPMEGMPNLPNKQNYLPAKYNTNSDLKREVKPGGPNEFNFDLTSK